MEEFEWVITELPLADHVVGVIGACGSAPTEAEARSEMAHYAMLYALDGEIQVQLFRVTSLREEVVNYVVTRGSYDA